MREYDYVIVGAGSAGCVLAARLSEDKHASVLVIEAGGSDRHPLVFMPAGFSKLFRSARDWNFSTDPEPFLGKRSLYVPRGKMLGGSSSMNAMLYVRGHAHDYDRWAELGATGWSWAEVLPYFKKSEDNARGASQWHGVGGPLRVEDLRSPHALSERFVEAVDDAGYGRNEDFNGPSQEGAGLFQVTQRRGRRWSTAAAFLRPAMRRRNVEVITAATVQRVIVDGPRATGVEYHAAPNGTRQVHCRREVILSAGAFGSPQLLMLSGIGPGDHLASHGIRSVVDLPVGDHLQDHPYVTHIYESKVGPTLEDAEAPANLAKFVALRRGPLTSTVAEAGAFLRSRDGLATPDLQFHFAPGYFFDHGFVAAPGRSFTLGPVLVSPKSRGRVRLRSADPFAPPSIVGHHLQDPDDVDALVRGMEIAREIASCHALAEIRGKELEPGPAVKSRDQLEAYLRAHLQLLYHPVGTCRMGPPGDAVVGPDLRVHGVDGLRVADASVMPVIIGGNTNAPTIMIAEKAADLIRDL
jgi:choline dehydrogenase-like flavoprotein